MFVLLNSGDHWYSKMSKKTLKLLHNVYHHTESYSFYESLKFISDEKNALELRAFRYYEFFAATHFMQPSAGKGSPQEFGADFEIPVYSKPLNAARLFCCLMLMDEIQSRAKEKRKRNNLSAIVNLIDTSFFTIYEKFDQYGGWRAATKLGRASFFQNRLQHERRKMKVCGALIDISIRSNNKILSKKEKGGITSAIRIFHENDVQEKFVKFKSDEKTTRRRWREGRRAAVFGYLFYFQKHGIILDVSKDSFGKKLLNWTNNPRNIKFYIGTYSEIQQRLASRGYKFPVLNFAQNQDGPAFELTLSDLSTDVATR